MNFLPNYFERFQELYSQLSTLRQEFISHDQSCRLLLTLPINRTIQNQLFTANILFDLLFQRLDDLQVQLADLQLEFRLYKQAIAQDGFDISKEL
jgi:hypothetical protein